MPKAGTTMSAEQRAKISDALAARAAARTHKRCPRCGEDKPLAEYELRRKGGQTLRTPRSYCTPCHLADGRVRSARYHRADPERAATRQRRTDLRLNYGLTVEAYDELLAAQGGGCAICSTTTPGSRKRYFAVDHEHDTGQVRGLLCIACNTGIGHLGDDVTRIRAAAAYLERHKVRSTP